MQWTKTKLGDFAPFVYGKGLPQAKRTGGEVPVYGSNGIVGVHSQAFVQEPAVIIGRKGSVGEVHLAAGPSWPIDTAFFALGSENVDLHFLYYLLKTLPITSNSDSAVPGLNREFAHSLEISVPDMKGQIAISNILFLLDQKIEANNALSKTLENIAQTIFKSWFIDFDPVKAKMVGEKPAGMDSVTAALFPDSMEESELGFIPKGWMVSNLESISSVKFGAPFASKLFNTMKVGQPLIRIRDLKKQSISTWSPENHPKGFLVSGGELIVGMDGEFNPTIWFGEDALVNQRICKIEPKDFVSNFFPYFTLVPIMRKIEHGSTGSTVIHLGKTDIDAIKISVPPRELLSAFKSLVEPLLKQMVSLNVQVRVLQEVRDALLPRLISGELQIPDGMLAS